MENSDVSNVVITLNAPKHLAIAEGAISGLAPDRFASAEVVLTGTTFNEFQVGVEQDGSFRFNAWHLSNHIERCLGTGADSLSNYEVPVWQNVSNAPFPGPSTGISWRKYWSLENYPLDDRIAKLLWGAHSVQGPL